MDSHLLRKAAWRLPALADLGVLRFNTRGTSSREASSGGEFADGVDERLDVEAAAAFARGQGLERLWLVGWSFGTELALLYGATLEVEGAILLSPVLRRVRSEHLVAWAASHKELLALIPEHDRRLKLAEAKDRFSIIAGAQVVGADGADHLWIGEKAVSRAMNEIVGRVRRGFGPLPATQPINP
jgi:alpha/beta superfamily hydrolase